MPSYELSPAYGRDYTSAKAAKAAWAAGQDWVGDYQCQFRPVSRLELDRLHASYTVVLRYGKLRKLCVVQCVGSLCSCGQGCKAFPWLCSCGNGSLACPQCEIPNQCPDCGHPIG